MENLRPGSISFPEPVSESNEGGIRVLGNGSGIAKPSGMRIDYSSPMPYYHYFDEQGVKRTLLLPYPRPISLPPAQSNVPINPNIVMIIMGGVMGGVMGAVMGLFLGAMGDVSPIQVVHGREVPQGPVREQLRIAWRSTGAKTVGWLKTFGVMSALFGGVECLIEKQRAKHDVWNPVVSGCVVGATLAAKAGPSAACVGCAGFAGFSFVVDKIMGTH